MLLLALQIQTPSFGKPRPSEGPMFTLEDLDLIPQLLGPVPCITCYACSLFITELLQRPSKSLAHGEEPGWVP